MIQLIDPLAVILSSQSPIERFHSPCTTSPLDAFRGYEEEEEEEEDEEEKEKEKEKEKKKVAVIQTQTQFHIRRVKMEKSRDRVRNVDAVAPPPGLFRSKRFLRYMQRRLDDCDFFASNRNTRNASLFHS